MTRLPIKSLLALATIAGTIAIPTAAEARNGFLYRMLHPFDANAYYPPPPDAYDPYYDDEYYLPRRFKYDDQQDSYYDPQYDEPRYVKPQKKKKTAKSLQPKKPPTQKSVSVASKNIVKPTPEATASTSAAPKASSSSMSCDKASQIISGYGFSGVTASSCTGQVYAFNATRGGKPYRIKLSAASGELTEVKKVQ
jgi:hypothetical protein